MKSVSVAQISCLILGLIILKRFCSYFFLTSVTFDKDALPACLPAVGGPRVYGQLQISGWGMLAPRGPQPSKLQTTFVTQRSQSYCSRMYGPKYTSRQLCANGSGRDVCNGDSGGPLTWRSTATKNKAFVVGIVSYGMICGYMTYPAVFTRTTDYVNWILSNTNTGQFCKR